MPPLFFKNADILVILLYHLYQARIYPRTPFGSLKLIIFADLHSLTSMVLKYNFFSFNLWWKELCPLHGNFSNHFFLLWEWMIFPTLCPLYPVAYSYRAPFQTPWLFCLNLTSFLCRCLFLAPQNESQRLIMYNQECWWSLVA